MEFVLTVLVVDTRNKLPSLRGGMKVNAASSSENREAINIDYSEVSISSLELNYYKVINIKWRLKNSNYNQYPV